MAKESALVSWGLKYLRSQGYFAEKMYVGPEGYMRKGFHDIDCCLHGFYVGIECKRDWHEKLSPAQEQVQKEVRAAGGIHIRAFRREDFMLLVELCRLDVTSLRINQIVDQRQEEWIAGQRKRRPRADSGLPSNARATTESQGGSRAGLGQHDGYGALATAARASDD